MKRFTLFFSLILLLGINIVYAGPEIRFNAASPGAIGSDTPAAIYHTSLFGKRTAVGTADYNPSTLTTDYIIAVDNTAAARSIIISTEDENSGSATNPRIMIVKDESGGASNINGAANYVLNQDYQGITIYLTGNGGFVY